MNCWKEKESYVRGNKHGNNNYINTKIFEV